ncbi:HD domain-containing protein [Microbacterium allomyrinae]|uniref:HD domain-containing protein n=1 Tax=Microbacterium allomyrinae TaxID=2830666 RepID=A0A9X1LX67_9MICO|nr:HD domain-containing protein [Microbacterium allomyrinae]MCC2033381.1 HD domain-containing protein [Microbacterium allomyrinae]
MTDTLALPTGPMADGILAAVHASESGALARHSIRTFLFAEIIAARSGADAHPEYDRDVLFAATVLHDLGLGSEAPGSERFEIEGADRAAALLQEHGMAQGDIERVWDAIALHTSAGIAERRGVIASLTRAGVAADLGRYADAVSDYEAVIHAAYPRSRAVGAIVDAVVMHAGRSATAGAPYTLAGELARERLLGGPTRLELSVATVPWST